MSDLYELLAPYFDLPASPSSPLAPPSPNDAQTTSYLTRLSTLSLADLATTEPASLLHAAQSHVRNLQALSKRSHKAVIASSSHLANLTSLLPTLRVEVGELKNDLPHLESAATYFAHKYDRSTENAVLDRRKRAMLLSRNVDRVSDILELPTLLSSTVSAAQTSSTTSTSSSATSYASALDLHAHIKRLNGLYPQSGLVGGIFTQAESEIQNLTTILITSLQSPNLKLAAAMRTIGWLRRVAPALAEDGDTPLTPAHLPSTTTTTTLHLSTNAASADGTLGSLFLVSRLHSLHKTLHALEPLRELADQESARRKVIANSTFKHELLTSAGRGTQTERYLKRYLELFREQSFAIVSMYKSVFPTNFPAPEASLPVGEEGELFPLPSPVSTFALHLVDLLTSTLREYMPNIADRAARESLLTQVLYCAGSLGRLGADFGMVVAILEEDLMNDAEDEDVGGVAEGEEEPEWAGVMKKHRVQASRLEILARGVGTGTVGRKGSEGVMSPTAVSAG